MCFAETPARTGHKPAVNRKEWHVMNRKQFLLTLAATATAATMLACGSGAGDTSSSVSGGQGTTVEPAAEPTTAVGKIGQTITLASEPLGDKTAVEVTVANAKQYTKEPGSFGSKPEKGVFLVLEVTVVCKEG